MVTVLAAPQHNNYDKESKVLEVNRDHWSALNPHRYESGYSHELHRLWNNLMVKKNSFLLLISKPQLNGSLVLIYRMYVYYCRSICLGWGDPKGQEVKNNNWNLLLQNKILSELTHCWTIEQHQIISYMVEYLIVFHFCLLISKLLLIMRIRLTWLWRTPRKQRWTRP